MRNVPQKGVFVITGIIILIAIGTIHLILNGGSRIPMIPQALAQTNAYDIGLKAPELVGSARDFLNTDGKPLRLYGGGGVLDGHHIVLVDFWEYTCVNCIRTLPYLKEWNQRYAKDGLVIIGIHTPEFSFAHKHVNVAAAVKRFGLKYPILIDSNYRNWQLWQGSAGYWPRDYLLDPSGRVVSDHAGEGGYAETEREIQKLLTRIHPGVSLPSIMKPVRPEDGSNAVCYPSTPEMYAGARGYEQGQLGNVTQYEPGGQSAYRMPESLEDGEFYLNGVWITGQECLQPVITSSSPTAKVTVKYHALGANAVIRPGRNEPFKLYVYQDGKPIPRRDCGADILRDPQGRTYVLVNSPRMYRLTKNVHFGSHVLLMETASPDLRLYSMTFTSCLEP